MHVLPKVFQASQVSESLSYLCPICRTQSTLDAVDTGWVMCPLLQDEFICLGCCIDLQKPARAADFESHPLAYLFQDLATQTSQNISTLRRICLFHQQSLLYETDHALAARIEEALSQITEE